MTTSGRLRVGLRGALLLGAAVGCGGGGNAATENADGGAWQPTAADQAFISDFCAAIAPCCGSQGRPADGGACQQTLRKAGFSHDSRLTSACLDELRQLAAAAAACVPNLADLGDSCARTFDEPSGPRAPGQSCSSNADCAGSAGTVTICSPAPTPSNLDAPPICVARAVGALGDHPC